MPPYGQPPISALRTLRSPAYRETPEILNIIGIYCVQGLAEVHCYLETVHQFEPAEVEALLQFADPLQEAYPKMGIANSFPLLTDPLQHQQFAVKIFLPIF